MVFCSHAAISLWFLLFFRLFGLDFFLNGFPNPFIVRSRSSFLFSQWKFFALYVRTCSMFYFVVKIFVSTVWRHKHFKSLFCSFIHAISTLLRAWCHFSLLVELVFLFICVIKFLFPRDLPHSQKRLPHFAIDFFTSNQRHKVIWMCVTLIEGYLRAAKRGSNFYFFALPHFATFLTFCLISFWLLWVSFNLISVCLRCFQA